MSYIYYPGCTPTDHYKEAAAKAAAYIKEKFGIAPIGCCRINHKKLTAEDTWSNEVLRHEASVSLLKE